MSLPVRRHTRTAAALAALVLLAACSSSKRLPGDDQPTLASLGTRTIKVAPDNLPVLAEEQTIAAYRQFLQSSTQAQQVAQAPQRAEALRRLGDLEMDLADRIAGAGTGSEPDYKAAIARYQDYLQAHPKDPGNHRVLYQLARAQEQGGQLEAALKTLSSLVAVYPGTQHAEEAQFRRGELLFAMRSYDQAEGAYAAVLQSGRSSPFQERALYMQGWSLFKQGRLEDALQPFFGVLDLKLGSLQGMAREEADLAEINSLKRADRELVEDSFRVMSISLAGLQGGESVARFITTPAREAYQFRVYGALGELYSRQERVKDAADTYALFVRRQPLHVQAPLLQARVIELYEKNGFDTLALQAKKDHVLRYGVDSEFRRANPGGWQRVQPLVQTHLAQLAQHHHALAQKTRLRTDVQEAVLWYRTLLSSFPKDPQAPAQRFLLAELLYEDQQWAAAATEYETVAYAHAGHPRGSDAGYAALLSYAEQEKRAADAAARAALQRASVASALRFAKAFRADTRGGPVLTRAAEQLFGLGDTEAAAGVARQALALQPPPAPEQRRTAWTVVAHHAFEQGRHAEAEAAYGEVLALSAAGSPGRNAAAERLAASIYKQGEAARGSGDARAAVGHFERVAALGSSGVLSATSAVRASAQFDAAAALIGLKDWARAAAALEAFRRQQPGHPLQAEVAPRLALAYLEQNLHSLAAAEFEKVSAAQSAPGGDATLARGALWQAAELHEKAAREAPPPAPMVATAPARKPATAKPAPAAAARRAARGPAPAPVAPPLAGSTPLMGTALLAYERYVQRYPQPLETAVEARWRVAELLRSDGQSARSLAWLRSVQQADAEAGDARTPRTRSLGGQATLALAEPARAAYQQVALVEPLAAQLKLKKARLEEVLRAYAAASEAGVAEVTTAATFHTASLYQDFGKALMESTRPRKLKKDELEQYNVMLEEQAFPFEEKAIELYETNARRTSAGLYDRWVQGSFTALAKLKPVRYGKAERLDTQLPAELPALQSALGRVRGLARAPLLNQQGVLQRQQGRFNEARQSYEDAIAADAAAAAPVLNLAILYDLYLNEPARALLLYQRCLELSPADAPTLGRWVAEIKARKPAVMAPAVPPPNVAAAPSKPKEAP